MKETARITAGLLLACLFAPSAVQADYSYPFSAAAQPLAVVEPVTEGTLFRTFRPTDVLSAWALGAGLDYYRIRDNSDDQDVIATVTGSWSFGPGWQAGLSLPYIVRDPDFNESGLLDMRLFVRRLFRSTREGLGLAGELTCTLPTGGEGDLYPLTLDSTIAGIRVSAAGAAGSSAIGLNLGYQSYLQTEGDSDSDLLYGFFLERPLSDRLTGILEYAGSRHSYEGTAGSDSVSDGYVTLGIHYRAGRGRLGASASFGSGDSAADARFMASVVMPLGQAAAKAPPEPAVKEPKPAREAPKAATAKPKAPPAAPPAAQGTGAVQVKVTNASGVKGLGRKVAAVLGEKGYIVSGVTDPAADTQERTVLLYPPALTQQAIALARTLTFSKTLMDIRLMEARTAEGPQALILVIGTNQGK